MRVWVRHLEGLGEVAAPVSGVKWRRLEGVGHLLVPCGFECGGGNLASVGEMASSTLSVWMRHLEGVGEPSLSCVGEAEETLRVSEYLEGVGEVAAEGGLARAVRPPADCQLLVDHRLPGVCGRVLFIMVFPLGVEEKTTSSVMSMVFGTHSAHADGRAHAVRGSGGRPARARGWTPHRSSAACRSPSVKEGGGGASSVLLILCSSQQCSR